VSIAASHGLAVPFSTKMEAMRAALAKSLILGLFLVPNGVSAQSAEGRREEAVGQRVRVWTRDGLRLEGTLVEADRGLATVEVRDDQGIPVRRSVEVSRAQVYKGQRRRIVESVLLGAGGGAILTRLLLELDSSGSSGGTFTGFSLDPWFVTAFGAAIGAPIGLIVGARRRSDVWKDEDLFLGAPVRRHASRGAVVDVGVRILSR